MTILKHELRRGKIPFIIWTGAIAFMLAVSVFLFPEMKEQMSEMGDMFSSMGSFSDAFGMNDMNFGTILGYYATECGNVLGLGGAFFAALCAVGILSKEEKGKTAEFLLTHPISRARVVTEKLIAVLIQITALNFIVYALGAASVAAIGESVPWQEITLLHLAYYIMQLEIACVCFGISAFTRRGSIGIGLGLAAMVYFLNIIANLTESAEFLKFITPFGYCDGAAIVNDVTLDVAKILIGAGIGVAGIVAAYLRYTKKDMT